MKLVIGSRGSKLALWQANYVASRLNAIGVGTQISIITTTGDKMQTAALAQTPGKGLFTKEIEEALRLEEIDVAVHSLKDLPTDDAPGLSIAAIPEREDPRDALLGNALNRLPEGARVGTSSNRRGAQLLALRPDLNIVPIRGNVDTRIRKLHAGEYDAIALALAGLNRLELNCEVAQILEPEQVCPAPGQGALGIQTRNRGAARDVCLRLNHEPTARAVRAERAALAALGGGCQLPVGAFATGDAQLDLLVVACSHNGSAILKANMTGSDPEELGARCARDLLSRGARNLLDGN